MKKTQLGFVAALAVSVSMVAACNLKTPAAIPSEGTIGSGNKAGTGGTVGAGGNIGGTVNTGGMAQIGDATIHGKVLDANGKPVVGATVMSGSSKTLTGADGSYTLKVIAGELVNIKVLMDGYILRDSNIPVEKGQTLDVTTSMVKADANLSHINAATGGKAVSADGKSELIFPAGALKGDADVRVTWLNPVEDASRPAAFSIKALADTAGQGGTTDAEPKKNDVPTVTTLNTTDLPGPLETKAYGDRKFFSPVAFAAIKMSNSLKDGESATLRMAVSDQVLADMRAAGDLKDSDLNQEIFPCFAWSATESTWDKPALSKVVKDENGKYWFEYTVRSTSLAAKYRSVLQVGDTPGSAQVELQVGGGRRVVDGTYTYGSLVERSSNETYDYNGFSSVTLSGNNYYSPSVSNLIRPNVSSTSYTGTIYASTMGTAEFQKWDREGMFRMAFPPGAQYQITAPKLYGLNPTSTTRSGVTATAGQPYLLPNPNINATQTQTIQATYVTPFYYNTDATLKLAFSGVNEPNGSAYTLTYTLDGAAKTAEVTTQGNAITLTLPRNSGFTAQKFVLKTLGGDGYGNDDSQKVSADIPVGSSKTVDVKMIAKGAK